MNRLVLPFSLLFLFCGIPRSQEAPPGEAGAPPGGKQVQARKAKKAPGKNARFTGLFYRAFYLQYGENKTSQAEKLYSRYLEKAGGKGLFASRAARELAAILEQRGEKDRAVEIRKRYTKPDLARRARRKGPPRGEGGRAPRHAWVARAEKQLAALRAKLEKLEESGGGDQPLQALRRRIERLTGILNRVKAGEIPPPSGGKRGRAGRGRRFDLSKMDPDRREALLERILENARKAARRFEQNGDEARSNAILEMCSKLEELVRREKWDEVTRILHSLKPRRSDKGAAGGRRRWSLRGIHPGGKGADSGGAEKKGEGGGGGGF